MARRKSTKKKQGNATSSVPVLFAHTRRAHRSGERAADALTGLFGTISFLLFNIIVFTLWILVNTRVLPLVPVFDPYPFGMLTMLVSLEAILLAVIVLMSQNRSAKMADVREEVAFQVNVVAEREITQMIRMLERIEKRLAIHEARREELAQMKNELDIAQMEERIIRG